MEYIVKSMTTNFFIKYGEWIWRIVLFLMLAAMLYLNNHYIGKTEYKQDQITAKADLVKDQLIIKADLVKEQLAIKADLQEQQILLREFQIKNTSEHNEINKVLNTIQVTLALMTENTARLSDHEQRLRITEQRQIDVLSRLKVVEEKERGK